MPHCTACRATVDADDNFCERCGHRLSDPLGVDATETAPESAPDIFRKNPLPFALSYPLGRSYEPMTIATIVSVVGFVLPPVLLVPAGYAIRVGRAAAHGESTRPEFDDLGGLFFEGLRSVVVLAVLWGVVAIVGASVWALGRELGVGAATTTVAVAVTSFVGLYATPAVLSTYSVTGRVGAAFAQGFAGEFAVQPRYLKAFLNWLLTMTVASVCLFVSTVFLVGPAVLGTYMLTVSGAFWGYQYREAAADGVVPAAERAGQRGTTERSVEMARSS